MAGSRGMEECKRRKCYIHMWIGWRHHGVKMQLIYKEGLVEVVLLMFYTYNRVYRVKVLPDGQPAKKWWKGGVTKALKLVL